MAKKTNTATHKPTDQDQKTDLSSDASPSEAWEHLKQSILAHTLPKQHFFVRPVTAVRQSLHLAQQAQQDRALFALLPAQIFDISLLDTLEQRALAFLYTEARWSNLIEVKAFPEIAAFIDEMIELRADILRATRYLWDDDPQIGPIVADIRKGRGHTDAAHDLLRLSELWIAHWDKAKGKSLVTREMLQRAANDSSRFLSYTDSLPPNEELQNATHERQQAWTFLAHAASEVSETGRYLFRHQDPTTRYPGLHNPTKTTPKTTKKAKRPTPTEPT